jgi:tetratricopeptide (TPR) repeat protein
VYDDKSLLYAYLDRADVYLKLAEKCDYERAFDPCYEALDHAKNDYTRALTIARRLGYQGLADFTEGFLRETDQRKELISNWERMHKMITSADSHPKKPDDVLVSEHFIAKRDDKVPAGLITLIEHAGGFAAAGDAQSSYITGLLHDSQGESDQALAAYLKAVDLLEEDRRRLRDGAARGTFLEDKIDFYYKPVLHLLQRGRHAEAFDLSWSVHDPVSCLTSWRAGILLSGTLRTSASMGT